MTICFDDSYHRVIIFCIYLWSTKVKLLTSQIAELTMDEFWFQTDPSLPVLAPGDKEKLAAKKTDEKGTITYLQQQIDSCEALAKRLSVKPMEIKNK